jgi:hypothetical protein
MTTFAERRSWIFVGILLLLCGCKDDKPETAKPKTVLPPIMYEFEMDGILIDDITYTIDTWNNRCDIEVPVR